MVGESEEVAAARALLDAAEDELRRVRGEKLAAFGEEQKAGEEEFEPVGSERRIADPGVARGLPKAAVEVVLGSEVKRANVPSFSVYEFVWDPVKGVTRRRKDGAFEVEPGLLWRDPTVASQSDRRTRLLLMATGQLVCGVKNKWNKWVVLGVGVVDPIAYAEIVKPALFDFPWLKKFK